MHVLRGPAGPVKCCLPLCVKLHGETQCICYMYTLTLQAGIYPWNIEKRLKKINPCRLGRYLILPGLVTLKCIMHIINNPLAWRPVISRAYPEKLKSIGPVVREELPKTQARGVGGLIFHYILVKIGPKIVFTWKTQRCMMHFKNKVDTVVKKRK